MCSKCYGTGFITEQMPGGAKLARACDACNSPEAVNRKREPRRRDGNSGGKGSRTK
ncbi:hypothetical protein FHS36_001432 [Streptomyces eurocidicus]|uniref:Uncharacterized protein n=1 Tax=Streptomyces eurocidicus TaxID=66423 RepID=A0A7W8B761_STREU|nr:hypothetical protein [Streptomyces eurocidicus]